MRLSGGLLYHPVPSADVKLGYQMTLERTQTEFMAGYQWTGMKCTRRKISNAAAVPGHLPDKGQCATLRKPKEEDVATFRYQGLVRGRTVRRTLAFTHPPTYGVTGRAVPERGANGAGDVPRRDARVWSTEVLEPDDSGYDVYSAWCRGHFTITNSR